MDLQSKRQHRKLCSTECARESDPHTLATLIFALGTSQFSLLTQPPTKGYSTSKVVKFDPPPHPTLRFEGVTNFGRHGN